jgi:hypothetical protein
MSLNIVGGGAVITADGSIVITALNGAQMRISSWAAKNSNATQFISYFNELNKMTASVPKAYLSIGSGGDLGRGTVGHAILGGDRISVSTRDPKKFGAAVAMHEFMHTLGYGHYSVDDRASLMGKDVGDFPGIFRIADINEILARYGLAKSYYGKNTTWTWGQVRTNFVGDSEGGKVGHFSVIVDGGGEDTLDFSTGSFAQTIDLRPSTIRYNGSKEMFWSSVHLITHQSQPSWRHRDLLKCEQIEGVVDGAQSHPISEGSLRGRFPGPLW